MEGYCGGSSQGLFFCVLGSSERTMCGDSSLAVGIDHATTAGQGFGAAYDASVSILIALFIDLDFHERSFGRALVKIL